MKKTPKQDTLEFIQKKYFREREKWECGLKNDYYQLETITR